jgi:hypothetical protein
VEIHFNKSDGLPITYDIGVFKRSHHIYMSGLQLFKMTQSIEEKSEEENENGIKYLWNDLKPCGGIYRVVGDKIYNF